MEEEIPTVQRSIYTIHLTFDLMFLEAPNSTCCIAFLFCFVVVFLS